MKVTKVGIKFYTNFFLKKKQMESQIVALSIQLI